MTTGASASAAYGAALTLINDMLLQQAYMLAIQDAFLFSLVLALLAIVASLHSSVDARRVRLRWWMRI